MRIEPASREELGRVYAGLIRNADESANWKGALPDAPERELLSFRRESLLEDARKKIKIDETNLDEFAGMVNGLVGQVSGVCGARLTGPLRFKVVPSEDFNEEAFPYELRAEKRGIAPEARDTVAHLAFSKTILVSDAFRHAGSVRFWDKDYLQLRIAMELCRATLEQARWEWGSSYARAMRAVGAKGAEIIGSMVRAGVQVAAERLCVQYHPEWGLYVAAGAILDMRLPNHTREYYERLRVLSEGMPLAQAMMVDALPIRKGEVRFMFFEAHPSFRKKRAVFWGKPVEKQNDGAVVVSDE
jgi:hypothetical protein